MPAHVIADRVQETTTTTGTGTVTLGGAAAQFQSFVNAVGDGNECDYVLLSGNGTDWETGMGYVHATPGTLSRDRIITSTNGGAAISLSGTSTVFLAPTARQLYGRFGRRPPRPALSTFTWVNQGTAFATDWAGGPLTLTLPPSASGFIVRALVQTPPSAPWTVTAEIECLVYNVSTDFVGLAVFDTVGKITTLNYGPTNGFTVQRYTNVTTGSTQPKALAGGTAATPRFWLRIYNDGTNFNYSISHNGADWSAFYAETVGSPLGTISSVGIYADTNNTTQPNMQLSLWSFELKSGTGSNVQWV